MNKSFRKKLLMYSFTLIFLLSFLAVHPSNAYDPTQSWTAQATGCKAVANNIGATLDYVYLGASVPSSISSQYPSASAGYLPLWKSNMVGMKANQFKSFIIPASQGYTQTSSPLYGKDLFFEVTILVIYNVDSSGVTTSNSLVKVQYSLYTDCQVASSYPDTNTGTGTTTTTTSAVANITTSPPNYTGIIVGGGLIGVLVLAAVGYVVMNGRKANMSTDKIIKETRQKETQNIQSLKESLLPNQNNLPKTTTKKQSTTRRRR